MWRGVEFWPLPLTCFVAFKTLAPPCECVILITQHSYKVSNCVWWQAIYSHSKAACKCHGVSGSCSTRTCWNQLPAFREVGGQLRRRYDTARQVAFNAHGTSLYPTATTTTTNKKRRKNSAAGVDRNARRRVLRRQRATRDDLVYLDASPDYCEPDAAAEGATTAALVTGSTGTHGRRCQRGSRGSGGCDEMCCGRGYDTQRWRVAERCHCRFHWCCYVKCKTCVRTENIYTCK